ncbi:aromatic ring-hydroxylating oxygenase subunit alpha [Mycobacterium avium]|uniref:aromatic ring-hydroxylating oxygenase subunit alpha n=1 Tax=Mycobacterium avium TaxID=1764 RepID=UPI0007A019A3|nr:aromatic ring-hydroxylating dioxygenase subunit alpha [Mycobacterium avium]
MSETLSQAIPEPIEFTPDQLPDYQDIVAKNSVGTVPPQFTYHHKLDYGIDNLSLDRYMSAEFHQREVEKVWKRVWQFACFEDDIPNVGDYITYEITGISVIVTRSAPDQVSAFYNTCLHRGAALAEEPGNTREFMCPYHGWRYSLDGTLTRIPAAWDFPTTCPGKDRLPQVQADTALGLVFISMDPSAPPLTEYLSPFPEYFSVYPPMNERARSAWVRKIVPVNWKAAQEAFMEGYHLPTSHPQLADTTQGYEMQYDGVGRHITRIMSAGLVPNWLLGPDITEQELLDHYVEAMGMPSMPVPEGMTARAFFASMMREMQKANGIDLSSASDPEVLDSPLYYIWPNLVIWGGYAIPWMYRFRPNGSDPTSSIMEIFQLNVVPKGQQRTHIPMNELGDLPFAKADELGFLGPVLDQDHLNLRRQSIGLRSTPLPGLRYSRYQESLIRHHHHVLDEYLGRP